MDDRPALTKSGAPSTGRAAAAWHEHIAVAIAIVALLALFGWHWYGSRSEMNELREGLARQLRDTDADSRDARLVAKQAQESVREAQAKLAQIEAKLVESQNQQVALEALYQELSRSRDEWVVAEVEQVLAIASQQLQLAGNVPAALLALQTADGRLARSDRPQFIPLRRLLAKDIERLKAVPGVDISGLALKLDLVIAQVDALPLGFESRPPAAARSTAGGGAEDGLWSRLGAEVWNEIRQLVRVRNLEHPEPALLSPSQAFFLRENLRLRLLNARLALLQRDELTFRRDTEAAMTWMNRYFDVRAKGTASALGTLKQVSASGISMEIPSIAETLAAVRNYKISREKASR